MPQSAGSILSAEATFDRINYELYDSAWKSQFFSGLMMPLMSFIGNFGYVVVCVGHRGDLIVSKGIHRVCQ